MENKEQMECPHLSGEDSIYVYELTDKLELWLCSGCNMNLASGIMSQIAISTFASDFKEINPKNIKIISPIEEEYQDVMEQQIIEDDDD